MKTKMWQESLRNGVFPALRTAAGQVGFFELDLAAAYEKLLADLTDDCEHLRQGCSTIPPSLAYVQDWPCEGGCFVSRIGQHLGLASVREVSDFFLAVCDSTDFSLSFLRWFDKTPRAAMRVALIPEVRREIEHLKYEEKYEDWDGPEPTEEEMASAVPYEATTDLF